VVFTDTVRFFYALTKADHKKTTVLNPEEIACFQEISKTEKIPARFFGEVADKGSTDEIEPENTGFMP